MQAEPLTRTQDPLESLLAEALEHTRDAAVAGWLQRMLAAGQAHAQAPSDPLWPASADTDGAE